ncbi:MAG: hypothetical protein WB562_14990 [Candidatus Sulfotelmatobacter sp.]
MTFVILAAVFSTASDIYIAQNAAGGNTGADCADAHAVSWFNSSSNWGSGNIAPGTTVHLCGTVSAPLTAQGSGASGSPITIAFDCPSNGQISMPAIPATGALTIAGLSYITIDGQGCGIIQSTNNGSPAGGYGNRIGSQAILATNTNNIEIKNLQCINLYMHLPPEQTPWGAPYPNCVNFTGTSSHITIDHNTFHDCAWCAWGQGSNISFHDNTIYNFDHGLGMGIQANTPTVWGPVYFYNNNLSNATTWDTGVAGQYHHDGLHLWAYCSDGYSNCPDTYWQDAYVYNNHFFGDWGLINTTAMIFAEGSDIHNFWVFNNLADCTANQCDDGIFSIQSTNAANIINNTVVANIATQVTPNLILGGPNLKVQNNVVLGSNFLIEINAKDTSGGGGTTIAALSNNVYMAGGTNAFVWEGTFLSFGQFSTWESDSGETKSIAATLSTVNLPAGTLQAASPAIGAAANLYSTCNGQPNPGLGALCSDADGTPRPATGNWDAGAFSASSGNMPNPPTGLAALIQ